MFKLIMDVSYGGICVKSKRKKKTTQHWFSYFQIARKIGEIGSSSVFYIVHKDYVNFRFLPKLHL